MQCGSCWREARNGSKNGTNALARKKYFVLYVFYFEGQTIFVSHTITRHSKIR